MKKDELEACYLAYYKSLLLFALSLTHNREDAEDLVADAFVKAYLSFEEGNFKAWIYTVIRNEFYNLYKKRSRMAEDGEFELEWLESPEDILKDLIGQEEKRWLYARIYEMEKKEQKVMFLSIDKEMDDAGIAQILGISVANVRVIRHRAKAKLIKLGKEFRA